MSGADAGLIGLAYLLGSIPFGVLVTRLLLGTDVRAQGSGNIGATNVMRVAGKKLGALVLFLDALKGLAPVLLARALVPERPGLIALTALTAVLGHVFPVWLRFRGGKGVATALGALMATVPVAALAGAATYVAMVVTTRVSAVGSLLGALVGVVVTFALGAPLYGYLNLGLLGLMLYTHRGNIRRLMTRTESRL